MAFDAMGIGTKVREQRLFVTPGPFARALLRGGLAGSGVLALVALGAGAIRVLPWLLEPDLPWAIAIPFARSVATLALEAAILVGWPVGWALAVAGLVERGEARVFATLGASPADLTRKLLPQAALFGAVLALLSLAGARDAAAPGRVLNEIVDRGGGACAEATHPSTIAVPLIGATWLCNNGAPGGLRVVAGSPPGLPLFFTARGARVAEDLRQVELDDAWMQAGKTRLHVGLVALRGLPPLGRASTVPPASRALALSLAAALVALAAVWLGLTYGGGDDGEGGARGFPPRLRAILTGAAGPLVALGLLRLAEGTPGHLLLLVPIASVTVTVVLALALSFGGAARRLPRPRPTATK
jgi:hypothetical protein